MIDFLCYSISDIDKSFNFYSKYTKLYFFISSCAVYDTRFVTYVSEVGRMARFEELQQQFDIKGNIVASIEDVERYVGLKNQFDEDFEGMKTLGLDYLKKALT